MKNIARKIAYILSFAMILGVVFGTLSSIFVAAPVAYLTMGKTIRDEEVSAVAEEKK